MITWICQSQWGCRRARDRLGLAGWLAGCGGWPRRPAVGGWLRRPAVGGRGPGAGGRRPGRIGWVSWSPPFFRTYRW